MMERIVVFTYTVPGVVLNNLMEEAPKKQAEAISKHLESMGLSKMYDWIYKYDPVQFPRRGKRNVSVFNLCQITSPSKANNCFYAELLLETV